MGHGDFSFEVKRCIARVLAVAIHRYGSRQWLVEPDVHANCARLDGGLNPLDPGAAIGREVLHEEEEIVVEVFVVNEACHARLPGVLVGRQKTFVHAGVVIKCHI